jgi:hypothetical protein
MVLVIDPGETGLSFEADLPGWEFTGSSSPHEAEVAGKPDDDIFAMTILLNKNLNSMAMTV